MIGNVNDLARFENEYELSFPIDEVKQGLKNSFLIKEAKILKVNIEDEDLNTYQFIREFQVTRGCLIDLNLKKVDEKTTQIRVTSTNTPGSKATSSIISRETTEYMQVLMKSIKGELKPDRKTPPLKEGKGGCVLTLLVGIGSLLAMSFFF